MRVSLAEALGTCFGVQDAIDLAMEPQFRGNLTILGQLVHNPQVVQQLRENGVTIVDRLEDASTHNIMITAHGTAQSIKDRVQAEGHTLYDASCPLVMRVHKKIAELVRTGYHVCVLGKASHVEVKGLVGDLDEYTVIEHIGEIDKLVEHDRVGIVCQTTQQTNTAHEISDAIVKRFPNTEIKFINTICKPTKDNQDAVSILAGQVDLMIVVGGYNSSNTSKLKNVCEERNLEVYHIERAEELQSKWFTDKAHVGITAGTSTPEWVIDEVYQALKSM